jgi:hypothetical protein
MVIIVRLDLDRYDALTISRFVREGIVTIGEATEAKCIKEMSDLHRLMWVRQVQDMCRVDVKKSA